LIIGNSLHLAILAFHSLLSGQNAMVPEDPWTDPTTWGGVTVCVLVALTPLLVFLPCVLQPDVDIQNTTRKQWFYSTEVGAHRILAEWHTFWLGITCVLSGVAQFLAWRENVESWYYPAAMVLFYVTVAVQWSWVASYFRLVNRFTTGRNCLFLALVVNITLACLYAPLHKLSTALVLIRIIVHDFPMFVIALAAARIHKLSDDWGRKESLWDNDRDDGEMASGEEDIPRRPKPSRGWERPLSRDPSPPKSAPPRRASLTAISEMLGFDTPLEVKTN
jgi:hypothetical protein